MATRDTRAEMSVGTDDLEHLQAESDILSAKARTCYAPHPAEAATTACRVHDWQAIDAQLEHEIAALRRALESL